MLKIIISPAKKMNRMEEPPAEASLPMLLDRTEPLKAYLCSLDGAALQKIWKCNDKIAAQNIRRLQEMDLYRQLTPAVFAYEGIQYQSMAPMVFSQSGLDYIREHLYILSGFYGILRAFDGVVPYRLEMQAKLAWKQAEGEVTSLYDYWGDRLYQALAGEAGQEITIVNLASKEYSKAVEPWLADRVRWITCMFGEMEQTEDGAGHVKVKATAAKMARGSMVRFMAEQHVTEPEQLKAFDQMGYRYCDRLSDSQTFVFVKDGLTLP